jgi:DNA-directed RNA polymerase subunit RPC12/RpoP
MLDAVKVVHGEWDVIEDDYAMETIFKCSVCKEDFVTIDGTPEENLWNYCPNCGARMDGDSQ